MTTTVELPQFPYPIPSATASGRVYLIAETCPGGIYLHPSHQPVTPLNDFWTAGVCEVIQYVAAAHQLQIDVSDSGVSIRSADDIAQWFWLIIPLVATVIPLSPAPMKRMVTNSMYVGWKADEGVNLERIAERVHLPWDIRIYVRLRAETHEMYLEAQKTSAVGIREINLDDIAKTVEWYAAIVCRDGYDTLPRSLKEIDYLRFYKATGRHKRIQSRIPNPLYL